MSVTIPTISIGGAVCDLTRATVAGTAGSGVSAVENRSGQQCVTTLTFDALTVDAIGGAANEAVGKLLYTLPAGATLIRAAFMDVALANTDTTIDADTPEIGLGSVIGTGAVAVLSGTPAFEDILTGQVAGDTTGTYTEKAVNDQTLMIADTGAHTIHLNVADDWAGADAGLLATGTVILEWLNLS